MDRTNAIELLNGLVAIPSLSKNEAAASTWLADQMELLGFDRASVDDAGNAVGEIGNRGAPHVLLLLGHIDTVPGNIPVRIETVDDSELLYGRGAVDAKGPLATFVAAAAALPMGWAREHDVRLVVVGAVEEEAATSKGARFIRDRFDGETEPIPAGCIIGEPSNWRRITLGYKGRILIDLEARQPMAHTAGPDRGVGVIAADSWQWIADYADHFNEKPDKTFDQLLPSLRALQTSTDDAMQEQVSARYGVRLPPGFDVNHFQQQLVAWVSERIGATQPLPGGDNKGICLVGQHATVELHFSGYEPAWRSGRNNALVRSFLAAIRTVQPGTRPGFVVKTGTSDMNVVGPAWQCPILAYGPGDSRLDHTPNEHIVLDEYWRAVQVLTQALKNWVGQREQ